MASSAAGVAAAENVSVVVRMRPKASSERGQHASVLVTSDHHVSVEPTPQQLAQTGISNKQSLTKSFTCAWRGGAGAPLRGVAPPP